MSEDKQPNWQAVGKVIGGMVAAVVVALGAGSQFQQQSALRDQSQQISALEAARKQIEDERNKRFDQLRNDIEELKGFVLLNRDGVADLQATADKQVAQRDAEFVRIERALDFADREFRELEQRLNMLSQAVAQMQGELVRGTSPPDHTHVDILRLLPRTSPMPLDPRREPY